MNKKHSEKMVGSSKFGHLFWVNSRKGIVFVLLVILVIGAIPISTWASEIEQAQEEKTNLEKKKLETETKLAELEKEKDNILIYIEKLDVELMNLSEEISQLEGDIDNATVDLEVARQELEVARKTEESQYAIMKSRIQYMYENGETEYIDVLLQSDSIADLLNHVEYMTKITEYDNNLLKRYQDVKTEVMIKENVLEDKLTNLNELKEELTFEQDTVEHLSNEKKDELDKYNQTIDETETLSAEYTSKILEQEALIDDLIEAEIRRIEEERKAEEERKRKEEEERKKQEAENEKNSGGGTGTSVDTEDNSETTTAADVTLSWPVPSSGHITSWFGGREQPTEGASTNHKGIDIGVPTGTEIVASAGGTVTIATYSVSAGNYIMISHGNGIYTVYMHCSKLYVSVGDKVTRGTVIALVGSTGFSTGPHLHFGVSINGTYVNPLNYVSY